MEERVHLGLFRGSEGWWECKVTGHIASTVQKQRELSIPLVPSFKNEANNLLLLLLLLIYLVLFYVHIYVPVCKYVCAPHVCLSALRD